MSGNRRVAWISVVRPSRRPLRGLLRMRSLSQCNHRPIGGGVISLDTRRFDSLGTRSVVRMSLPRCLRLRPLEGQLHLLVAGADRRDFLVCRLFGSDPHLVEAVFSIALLPHLQGEGDMVGALSRKVRRLARTLRPVAIIA